MDGLPLGLLNGLGTGSLAVLMVLGFATGRIYTRAQVTEMQQRHEAELTRLVDSATREVEDANHERSEWRTEARLNQQTVVELNEQNRAMLTAFGPTLASFLDSVRQVANLRSESEKR